MPRDEGFEEANYPPLVLGRAVCCANDSRQAPACRAKLTLAGYLDNNTRSSVFRDLVMSSRGSPTRVAQTAESSP